MVFPTAWRPCLISGKSPYKELLPILCLVWPASMWCRRSHGWASQHAGKEPRWCSGSACCLRGVDSRTSPPPPASRGVLQTLPCYVSYHVKYKYSNNYVSLLSSQRIMMDSQPSLDPTFFPIPSWSWLKRPGSISIHISAFLQLPFNIVDFSFLCLFRCLPLLNFTKNVVYTVEL